MEEMKIMVIGGGGREHALIKSLLKNSHIEKLFALPGNGGIALEERTECVPIGPTDLDAIVAFAKDNEIDYAVVAPDDPLVLGLVDLLEETGIPCFGPNKSAAIIEGSKSFAKNLMKKHGIPTASYEVFSDSKEALRYVEDCPLPTVIKADGLALGKGVIIAETGDEARSAIKSIMEDRTFGNSGSTVVIEEFLRGPEISVLAFTDGKNLIPMVSSMDHKRSKDGDTGLNTGGMGTIAPNPYYTEDVAKRCMEEIFLPTIRAMKKEGRPFRGCLYFGLMLTEAGPRVIEYNCRFGDPETQVVLPLLKSDLLDIMLHVTSGTLNQAQVEFSSDAACCVVMASDGYPEHYEKGFEISLPEDRENIFIAGAKLKDGKLLTSGGRVLGVTQVAKDLKTAVEFAYNKVKTIDFDNAYYRKDIGKRALRISETGEENGI